MRAARKTADHDETHSSGFGAWHHVDDLGDGKDGAPAAGASQNLKLPLNILAALAVVAFLYLARSVFLPILLAAVGAVALKPLLMALLRWHIPRALGAGLIVGTLLCILGFGFVELSQPAMKWISNAPQSIGQLRQRVDKLLPTEKIKQATDVLSDGGADQKNQAQPVQVKQASDPTKAINWTAGFLGGFIETTILLYMFLLLGDTFLNKIFDGDGAQGKRLALNISNEVQQTISNYLLTVSVINFSLGICIGTGLYFLGVPNAVLWGLLAALLNYIPYFGPIVGIIIIAAVGVLTVDTFPKSILPAALYSLLHITEADFITPVLLGRHFTINPLVIFVSLLFGVWLWGVLGALLAVPLLITLKVLCQRVPALSFGNRFL